MEPTSDAAPHSPRELPPQSAQLGALCCKSDGLAASRSTLQTRASSASIGLCSSQSIDRAAEAGEPRKTALTHDTLVHDNESTLSDAEPVDDKLNKMFGLDDFGGSVEASNSLSPPKLVPEVAAEAKLGPAPAVASLTNSVQVPFVVPFPQCFSFGNASSLALPFSNQLSFPFAQPIPAFPLPANTGFPVLNSQLSSPSLKKQLSLSPFSSSVSSGGQPASQKTPLQLRTANSMTAGESNSLAGSPATGDCFAIVFDKIGADGRTTLCIKNIPNKYTKPLLLALINQSFTDCYDFFYLPIDFRTNNNVGYAFINFVDVRFVGAFYRRFHRAAWPLFNSKKICEVSYAKIQGKNNCVAHFEHSVLMQQRDSLFRPFIADFD